MGVGAGVGLAGVGGALGPGFGTVVWVGRRGGGRLVWPWLRGCGGAPVSRLREMSEGSRRSAAARGAVLCCASRGDGVEGETEAVEGAKLGWGCRYVSPGSSARPRPVDHARSVGKHHRTAPRMRMWPRCEHCHWSELKLDARAARQQACFQPATM